MATVEHSRATRAGCEVAVHENGEGRSVGRVETSPEQLEPFARSLAPDARVALERTAKALTIALLASGARDSDKARAPTAKFR